MSNRFGLYCKDAVYPAHLSLLSKISCALTVFFFIIMEGEWVKNVISDNLRMGLFVLSLAAFAFVSIWSLRIKASFRREIVIEKDRLIFEVFAKHELIIREEVPNSQIAELSVRYAEKMASGMFGRRELEWGKELFIKMRNGKEMVEKAKSNVFVQIVNGLKNAGYNVLNWDEVCLKLKQKEYGDQRTIIISFVAFVLLMVMTLIANHLGLLK